VTRRNAKSERLYTGTPVGKISGCGSECSRALTYIKYLKRIIVSEITSRRKKK
jgi:hypothetical protein